MTELSIFKYAGASNSHYCISLGRKQPSTASHMGWYFQTEPSPPQSFSTVQAINFAIQLQKQLSSWQVSEHSHPTRSTPQLSPTKATLCFAVSRVQSLRIQARSCQQWVVVDGHSLHCPLFLLHCLYTAFENYQVLATEQVTNRQINTHQLSYNKCWMLLQLALMQDEIQQLKPPFRLKHITVTATQTKDGLFLMAGWQRQ